MDFNFETEDNFGNLPLSKWYVSTNIVNINLMEFDQTDVKNGVFPPWGLMWSVISQHLKGGECNYL